MADGTLGLADIAAIGSGSGAAGGWMGAGLGFIGGLILASVFGGGLFGRGAGFSNAIGYENLATSSEVQRGFDAQNSMANQRETLAAVTAGTAQSVATTNQVFHDIVGYVGDKYDEQIAYKKWQECTLPKRILKRIRNDFLKRKKYVKYTINENEARGVTVLYSYRLY